MTDEENKMEFKPHLGQGFRAAVFLVMETGAALRGTSALPQKAPLLPGLVLEVSTSWGLVWPSGAGMAAVPPSPGGLDVSSPSEAVGVTPRGCGPGPLYLKDLCLSLGLPSLVVPFLGPEEATWGPPS